MPASDKPPTRPPSQPVPASPNAQREARLAQALRANLRRRKTAGQGTALAARDAMPDLDAGEAIGDMGDPDVPE